MVSIKKINYWFLLTIICKRYTRFSIVSKLTKDRYDKWNTVMFQKKKTELAFEIGLPVNETQFSKTTITKNNFFHIN